MRLEEVMSENVETIAESRPADEAWELMRLRGIHHLVVTGPGGVIGVLSARDLGGRRGESLRDGKLVADVMTPYVVTADPRAPVRSAANLLRGRSIGCLPIVDKRNKLVGIVTITDLLELVGRGLERPVATTERHPARRKRIRPPRTAASQPGERARAMRRSTRKLARRDRRGRAQRP